MTALAASPVLHRPDGSALRVLVVDDEQMLTDLLSMALRMEGWEVRTAGSGFDALAQAREFDPDAMVLDIMMPDLDGMAVLQRLRHAATTCRCSSSPKDAVADRVAGLTAGGDDYVTKPFSLEEVVARLRGLMRRAGPRRRAAPTPSCASAS
jgi:two-component system OmpR family response regulator